MKDLILIETILGIIGAIANLFVCCTYLLFQDLRKLRYVELVFYISINNLIGSVGIALGRQPTGSIGCGFQAFTTTANWLSAIFWATVVSYQVFLVVEKGKILSRADMPFIHCVCWIFPLVMALLPLSTNTYGNTDDQDTWCFIGADSDSPWWGLYVWELLSFYFWVWVAIMYNCYLYVRLTTKIRQMPIVSPHVASTMRTLIWYPVVISTCWLPATAADVYALWSSINPLENYPATILACMPSIILPALFFANMNATVSSRWKDFINKTGVSLCGPCWPVIGGQLLSTDRDTLIIVSVHESFDYVEEENAGGGGVSFRTASGSIIPAMANILRLRSSMIRRDEEQIRDSQRDSIAPSQNASHHGGRYDDESVEGSIQMRPSSSIIRPPLASTDQYV